MTWGLVGNAKTFQNSYIAFEVPDDWTCAQEGVAWTCTPRNNPEAKEAVIVLAAKVAGPLSEGHTLSPMLEITELLPQRPTGVMTMRATIHNQENELVLEGMHRYLLRKRPSA